MFNHLRLFFKSRQPASAIKVKVFNLHNALVQELVVQVKPITLVFSARQGLASLYWLR